MPPLLKVMMYSFEMNWYQSFNAYLSLGLGLPLLIDLLVMYVHSSFLSLQHLSKTTKSKTTGEVFL